MPDSLYNKARFFAIVTTLHKNNASLSDSIAQTIRNTSKVIEDLKNLCSAGIALYNEDIDKYTALSRSLNTENYLIKNEKNGLSTTYYQYLAQNKKSPAKAALFSAILPGSGKWYLGKKGQAITSFLTVAILASISAELISKNGWQNFYSISSLATTAVFYGGNIYGSYYLGKYLNHRESEKIKEDIQYYLHVAVRNVYN
jgi:TM2 domain-containing membrane protein YozV